MALFLKLKRVGTKKPLMIFGKPIYDIHGNVLKWMEDWYESQLAAGTAIIEIISIKREIKIQPKETQL